MRALAATLLVFLAISGGAPARAAMPVPRVYAVDKCPARAACVVVDIVVAAKTNNPDRIVGPANSLCDGKIYRVRGRLRGSGVRSYELVLQGECLADCADGRAAYYGRSARNAPVIATNLGRFEIVDDGVEVGAAGDLIVIDEANGKVAAYIGNTNGSSDYFVERDRVYMRHDKGDVCVAAPQERPGFLGIAGPQHCRAPEGEQATVVDFKDLAPPSRADLDRFFKPYKPDKPTEEIVRGRIRRVGGLIVVQTSDNCYH